MRTHLAFYETIECTWPHPFLCCGFGHPPLKRRNQSSFVAAHCLLYLSPGVSKPSLQFVINKYERQEFILDIPAGM